MPGVWSLSAPRAHGAWHVVCAQSAVVERKAVLRRHSPEGRPGRPADCSRVCRHLAVTGESTFCLPKRTQGYCMQAAWEQGAGWTVL